MPMSYPGSGVLDSTDGAGALRSITGATPAPAPRSARRFRPARAGNLIAFRAVDDGAAVANRLPASCSTTARIRTFAVKQDCPGRKRYHFEVVTGGSGRVFRPAGNGEALSVAADQAADGRRASHSHQDASIQAGDQYSAFSISYANGSRGRNDEMQKRAAATYNQVQGDGTLYFHRCPPLSLPELVAAVAAGKVAMVNGETPAVAITLRTYERNALRDENLPGTKAER
jgi:hypothetical protein